MNVIFSTEVTDKDRNTFARELTDRWDHRLMEELIELWETNTDGTKEANRLFSYYFDKNCERFEGLPWREVVDHTLVYLFGYSARTIAERAGMIQCKEKGDE